MLQRIQTVYLAIALLAVASTLLMDWVTYMTGTETISFMSENQQLVMQVLVGISLLTIVLVIFRYKDRKGQMKFANVAMFDMLLLEVVFGVLHYEQINLLKKTGEIDLSYDIASAMPVIAIILIWIAKKAIKKDDDLVKSVDRLR